MSTPQYCQFLVHWDIPWLCPYWRFTTWYWSVWVNLSLSSLRVHSQSASCQLHSELLHWSLFHNLWEQLLLYGILMPFVVIQSSDIYQSGVYISWKTRTTHFLKQWLIGCTAHSLSQSTPGGVSHILPSSLFWWCFLDNSQYLLWFQVTQSVAFYWCKVHCK